tara:strand:- start:82 stop:249 length:168 start_codon:yes stop_codon:yes gene_type:complete
MDLKSYSVRYKDGQSNHQQLQTLANDSYDARLIAIKKIQYLSEHPHAIDHIYLNT